MKSYLPLAIIGIGAIGIWLWQQLNVGVAPPAPLVPDMVAQPRPTYAPPPPASVPFDTGAPAPEAAELYRRSCAACHGGDATGRSYVTQQEGMPQVADLTASTSTEDEQLDILANGRGAMPAFARRLSETQRKLLIHYIRTLP